MKERFQTIGVPWRRCSVVPLDDDRIPKKTVSLGASSLAWTVERPTVSPREVSCTLGHLDAIKEFLRSDAEYGIFCENDVHLRRDLPYRLSSLVAAYETYGLDLLLLGYLCDSPPSFGNNLPYDVSHQRKFAPSAQLKYIHYAKNVWGAQMYMISRRKAEAFLTAFNEKTLAASVRFDGYVSSTPQSGVTTPFIADYTITKFGKRALVYPMMAVEEGETTRTEPWQIEFHKTCHKVNYDPLVHV